MEKVLIIHHCGAIGGAGLSLYHISKVMNSMENNDVYVYCPNTPTSICDWLEDNSIKVIKGKTTPIIFNHYSGSSKFILSKFSLTNLWNILMKKNWGEIESVIDSINPDIVILNSMTLIWMGRLIKRKKIKLICFHRETYTKGLFGLRTWVLKKSLQKYFDAVAFISENDLIETGKITGYSTVITDKVNLADYKVNNVQEIQRELGIDPETINILYMGGMSKLKGAHIIVKALCHLKRKNVKLIFLQYGKKKSIKTINQCEGLIGKLKFLFNFDYEARVLRYINKKLLWDRIDFFPPTTKPEKYILSADIVVFPSTKAHQARPIYESGAAKKPIIITDFYQTKEFAKNRCNCLVFKKNDHIDLANKIEELYSNSKLYNEIVENNYIQTVKNHNINSMNNELKNLLSHI